MSKPLTLTDIARVAARLDAFEQGLQITGGADCELAIVVDADTLERVKAEARSWCPYGDNALELSTSEIHVCGVLVLARP